MPRNQNSKMLRENAKQKIKKEAEKREERKTQGNKSGTRTQRKRPINESTLQETGYQRPTIRDEMIEPDKIHESLVIPNELPVCDAWIVALVSLVFKKTNELIEKKPDDLNSFERIIYPHIEKAHNELLTIWNEYCELYRENVPKINFEKTDRDLFRKIHKNFHNSVRKFESKCINTTLGCALTILKDKINFMTRRMEIVEKKDGLYTIKTGEIHPSWSIRSRDGSYFKKQCTHFNALVASRFIVAIWKWCNKYDGVDGAGFELINKINEAKRMDRNSKPSVVFAAKKERTMGRTPSHYPPSRVNHQEHSPQLQTLIRVDDDSEIVETDVLYYKHNNELHSYKIE